MDYEELEGLVSEYNGLVRRMNGILDRFPEDGFLRDAPYESMSIVQVKDNPESDHLAYIYFQFNHLPLSDGSREG